MPLVERVMQFFQCVHCAGEWPAKDPAKRPIHCRFCKALNWFEGRGKVKFKRATLVRTIGHKQRAVLQTGTNILNQIKRIEREEKR